MSWDLKVCITLCVASIPNLLNLEMIAFLTAFQTTGIYGLEDTKVLVVMPAMHL